MQDISQAPPQASAFVLSALEELHRLEVQDAELGLRKVTHPQVQTYVKHVGEDHAALLEQSRRVREQFGIAEQPSLPPPGASTNGRSDAAGSADWMSKSGPAADVAYLDQTILRHERGLRLVEDAVASREKAITDYLDRTRIVMETHRAILLDLQKMLFMTRYFDASAPVPASSTPRAPSTNGSHPAK